MFSSHLGNTLTQRGMILTAATIAVLANLQAPAPVASAGEGRGPSFCKHETATCRVEGFDLRAPVDGFTRLSDLGRGNILAVAFLPDGQQFVVGSAHGLAVYDRTSTQPPRWLAFDSPFWYDRIKVEPDGAQVRLFNDPNERRVSLTDGLARDGFMSAEDRAQYGHANDWPYQATSEDGALLFRSDTKWGYEEGRGELEYLVRDVIDTATGETLFTLTDDSPYASHYEVVRPMGCDVYLFRFCGTSSTDMLLPAVDAEFAPSGETLTVAYAGALSDVRVYDLADGHLLRLLGGRERKAVDVAYSPDSRELLIGYADGSIQIHSVSQPQIHYAARHFSGGIRAFDITDNGQFTIIQRGRQIELRRASDGALITRYPATTFALSPRGDLMAVGQPDGQILVLDMETGAVVRQLEAHTKRVLSLSFSDDGRLLASSSEDCTIKLWDLSSGEFLHLFEETVVSIYEIGPQTRIFIYGLSFLPGTRSLLGFGSQGTMVRWNMDTGATEYVVNSEALTYYSGMMTLDPHYPSTFHIDQANNRFTIGEQAYDLDTGKPLETVTIETRLPEGYALTGLYTPDGRYALGFAADGPVDRLYLFDADRLTLAGKLTVIPEALYNRVGILQVRWSATGQVLLVALTDGTIARFRWQAE